MNLHQRYELNPREDVPIGDALIANAQEYIQYEREANQRLKGNYDTRLAAFMFTLHTNLVFPYITGKSSIYNSLNLSSDYYVHRKQLIRNNGDTRIFGFSNTTHSNGIVKLELQPYFPVKNSDLLTFIYLLASPGNPSEVEKVTIINNSSLPFISSKVYEQFINNEIISVEEACKLSASHLETIMLALGTYYNLEPIKKPNS